MKNHNWTSRTHVGEEVVSPPRVSVAGLNPAQLCIRPATSQRGYTAGGIGRLVPPYIKYQRRKSSKLPTLLWIAREWHWGPRGASVDGGGMIPERLFEALVSHLCARTRLDLPFVQRMLHSCDPPIGKNCRR